MWLEGVKAYLASRAVWSGLLGVFSIICGFFGFDVSADDQLVVVDAVQVFWASLAAFVTSISGVYFRIKATKKLQ